MVKFDNGFEEFVVVVDEVFSFGWEELCIRENIVKVCVELGFFVVNIGGDGIKVCEECFYLG